LHELDLVRLRRIDAPGHIQQLLPIRAVRHQRRHFDGLLMVRNHILQELCVSARVARIRKLNRLFCAELSRWGTGRARLHDGRLSKTHMGYA
jgi:hypothetical protein